MTCGERVWVPSSPRLNGQPPFTLVFLVGEDPEILRVLFLRLQLINILQKALLLVLFHLTQLCHPSGW